MSEEITPEQEAKIPEYLEKWLKIGVACGDCDFEAAKDAVRRVYSDAGEKCPEVFYLADSPLSAAKLAVDLMGVSKSDPKYRDKVYAELNNQVFGSHEAGWLCYYDFMLNEVGKKEYEKIVGLMDLAKVCGWWAPYDTCVILQHKHDSIILDSQMRLHNENGPASSYRDGVELWALNGIPVSKKTVLNPDDLTVEEIDQTLNTEERATMINRLGWGKYLKKSRAILLDERENYVENTIEALYSTKMYGNRFVVTCPTARIFVLGVPDTIKTCQDAQRWLGNDVGKKKKYNVIGRT